MKRIGWVAMPRARGGVVSRHRGFGHWERFWVSGGVLAGLAVASMLAIPARAVAASVVGSEKLKVTYEGSGDLKATVQFPPCDPSPSPQGTPCSDNEFYGSGSWDYDFTGWTSKFAPIAITAQNKVSGAFLGHAPVSGLFLAGSGRAKASYVHQFSVDSCQISGTFSVDPATPPAIVRVTPSGPRSAVLTAEPAPQLAGKELTNNCPFEFPGPNPPYPDIFRGQVNITPAMLEEASRTITVDPNNPAAYQVPPDCTADARKQDSQVKSCSQSLTWQGKITIKPVCAELDLSPQQKIEMTPDSSWTFGAKDQVDMGGGNVIVVGKGAEISARQDCFSFETTEPSTLDQLQGALYEAIGQHPYVAGFDVIAALALSGSGNAPSIHPQVTSPPQASLTLSVHQSGKRILHVVSGGVVLTARYHHLKVYAGRTLLLLPNGSYRKTTWPPSDRALVPRPS